MIKETVMDTLAWNAKRIQQIVDGVPEAQARWKPGTDQWSMIEVLNHLADEEKLDFSTHLQEILQEQPWTSINPLRWVEQHAYVEKNLEESLQRFLLAREATIRWLQVLPEPLPLNQNMETPFGKLVAGDLLHSWIAHDFLHLRQLIEIHYLYTAQQAAPYQIQYAGDW